MDKPEQDANRKFEGGIFSGGVRQMTMSEQNPRMDDYFDYACQRPGKQQNGSLKWQPEENPPYAEKQKEEAEGAKKSESQNIQDEKGWQEPYRQQKQAWRQEEMSYWENQRNGGYCQGYESDLRQKNPGSEMSLKYENCKCGTCKCMCCPHGRKQGHAMSEILAIVAVAGLVIAFLATVLCLVKISSWQVAEYPADTETETLYEKRNPSKENTEGWYGENPVPETGNGGDYYGEIADAIRTDLDYSVEWENYEYEGNSDSVMIAVDYPVIRGNVPNLGAINDMIDDETEYFEEYYKEYSKYMMPEERFMVYSEGYVTFMDAEVMSVVFCEMIYTDYWTDYGLYCLNIDMENGVVLDNNSIIDIDDEFAVDFRKRCRQQNGAVNALDAMTDQEIVYYLTSGGTAILFYTPMGIEVGMNFGEYYVTVTYKDYEKFLQKY